MINRIIHFFLIFVECFIYISKPIAAGALIVREAGGVCLDSEGTNLHYCICYCLIVIWYTCWFSFFFVGGPLDIMSRRMICASSEQLAQQIIPLLTQMKLERD